MSPTGGRGRGQPVGRPKGRASGSSGSGRARRAGKGGADDGHGKGKGKGEGSKTPGVGGRVVRAALPATRRRNGSGCGAVVAVVEAVGGPWDLACAVADGTVGAGRAALGSVQAAVRSARRAVGRAQVRTLAGILSAVGSPHRLKVLLKLLEGPATYQALRKATGLKAGPLYHHVAQLRLAGLIRPKERDLYELTRGGRNLLLVALTLPRLVKDSRPRPTAVENPKGR